jgi:hypothetical protein
MDSTTCPYCQAEIPATARFCVECGRELPRTTTRLVDEVQLPNARAAQSVVGGTIKLATSGAIPPGLWAFDQPPTARDVIAVYAPLRAVVGGWSGIIDAGWQLRQQLAPHPGSTMPRFQFTTTREWFPAEGCGAGMRLLVRIVAEAEAEEGRTRRGFRYRAHYDPPMQVEDIQWLPNNQSWVAGELPLPEIQIMAPPRIQRVSDIREQPRTLPEPLAVGWAREGKIHEAFHLISEKQQRTPAGRGLLLGAVASQHFLTRIFYRLDSRYYVRMTNPLRCSWQEWQQTQRAIGVQAQGLGLALETDATVEWWLDQQGHDGLVLEDVREKYEYPRVAIAFRRGQLVRVEGKG